ncbi:MAG: glycosyltransferase 61 family protein, partial [Acutalibacteraceae bacterium]
HFFTECLNRLWYVLEKEDTKTKIAFLTLGDADFYDDFFALAGIKKERIIYITAPTKFRKIIVPDQSVYLRDCYTEKADIVYKKIRENAPKKDCDKLYLSRSKYSDTMMGEEFFEKFYKKQGYTVIHPETLPITEQIAYVSSAKEIVATIGTLSHFVVFAEKGAHLTTLLRSNEIKAHNAQSVINAFKEIRSDIVDVDMHLLPIRHTSGIFLILPNSHFKDYLKANSITFEEEDFSYNLGDYMLPYYKRWLSRYTEQNRYDHLISFDISDVISTVSALVDDKSFPREKLDQTERRNKLIKDNKKLREIKENQKSKYENLREKYLALKESNKELNDKYERLVEKSDALEKDLREARADLNATKMELEAEKNKGFFKKHKKS